jgi:hypothetical protein
MGFSFSHGDWLFKRGRYFEWKRLILTDWVYEILPEVCLSRLLRLSEKKTDVKERNKVIVRSRKRSSDQNPRIGMLSSIRMMSQRELKFHHATHILKVPLFYGEKANLIQKYKLLRKLEWILECCCDQTDIVSDHFILNHPHCFVFLLAIVFNFNISRCREVKDEKRKMKVFSLFAVVLRRHSFASETNTSQSYVSHSHDCFSSAFGDVVIRIVRFRKMILRFTNLWGETSRSSSGTKSWQSSFWYHAFNW